MNFFEATTVYFGKKPAVSHICESRAEAELIYTIAQPGLPGSVPIHVNEPEWRHTAIELEKRLTEGRRRLEELTEQRAGTDKLREQISQTLYYWFIHGRGE